MKYFTNSSFHISSILPSFSLKYLSKYLITFPTFSLIKNFKYLIFHSISLSPFNLLSIKNTFQYLHDITVPTLHLSISNLLSVKNTHYFPILSSTCHFTIFLSFHISSILPSFSLKIFRSDNISNLLSSKILNISFHSHFQSPLCQKYFPISSRYNCSNFISFHFQSSLCQKYTLHSNAFLHLSLYNLLNLPHFFHSSIILSQNFQV